MTTLTKNSTRGLPTIYPTWNSPLDRFFKNDLINLWEKAMPDTIPSVNIKEQKDSYIIEMAAPGLKKDNFNIDVDGNILIISSEKESETQEGKDGDDFSRREYNYSSFSRSLTLPDNTDTGKIKAKYNDGILALTVPKKEDVQKNKNQKIKIE
jgi:HSP20 family protein